TKGKTRAKLPAKKVARPTKKVTTQTKKVTTPTKKVTTPATKVTTPPVVGNAASGSAAKKTTSSGSGSKTSATGKTPTKTTPLPNNTSTTEPKLPICPINAGSPPPSRASSRTSSPGTSGKIKKTRDFDDSDFKGLFRRDEFEFVGFHGTFEENAIRYQQEGGPAGKGHIPVLSKFNGRDGELGGGLYVTDKFSVAQSFAGSAARFHRLNQAKEKKCSPRTGPDAEPGFVCIVEARVSSTFRSTASKMWIPAGEVASSNNPEKMKKQEDRIKKAGMDLDKTLRFSILDVENRGKPDSDGNQFMLPPDAFEDFV
ncbi:hypothetical protein PQX77_002762, partial [Marasmius sp. AFHP31]